MDAGSSCDIFIIFVLLGIVVIAVVAAAAAAATSLALGGCLFALCANLLMCCFHFLYN